MSRRFLWVVEFLIQHPNGKDEWAPTFEVEFTRDAARELIKDWRASCPDDKYRVRQYAAEDGGKK